MIKLKEKQLSKKEIPPRDIQFSKKMIGSGGFGEVSIVYYNSGEFACKKIPKHLLNQELEIALTLDDERLIRTRFWAQDEAYVNILMEAIDYTLYEVIKDPKRTFELSPREKIHVLKVIAQAVQVLHNKYGICHRDIKSLNILLRKTVFGSLIVKLADFGISVEIKQGNLETKTHRGTSNYLPKEFYTGSYTPAIDVYSIGAVMFEVLYDEIPWGSCLSHGIKLHLYMGLVPTSNKTLPNCFVPIQDLITECFKPASDRIKLDDLVSRLEVIDLEGFPLLQILSLQQILANLKDCGSTIRGICKNLYENKTKNKQVFLHIHIIEREMGSILSSLVVNQSTSILHFEYDLHLIDPFSLWSR